MKSIVKRELEINHEELMILEESQEVDRAIFFEYIGRVEASISQSLEAFHSDNYWNLSKKLIAFCDSARNNEKVFESYCKFPKVFFFEFSLIADNHLGL